MDLTARSREKRPRETRTILVADGAETIAFGFDDLVRYHGTRSICGLTVAFKVMEAAWEALWSDAPPERDAIEVASGFPGPGTRDGFEMVTRAVTRGTYAVLPDARPGPLVAEAAKGAYLFRLSDGRRIVELGLKPEIVPHQFVPMRRRLARGEATEGEARSFRALQFTFSDTLRALAPSDAVNVIDVRRVA